jgi:hypothetical protein
MWESVLKLSCSLFIVHSFQRKNFLGIAKEVRAQVENSVAPFLDSPVRGGCSIPLRLRRDEQRRNIPIFFPRVLSCFLIGKLAGGALFHPR